ncbi:hypothetical protein [Methylobacterium sp. E-045]|uniref:hypothetical protein n=1 Tax=Methylobacterium sp. E-045 TaxID=2836575 RepID=UPI001FBAD956|nr:hypothetical protein [Methylobacterium sp. E-045]MCJ2131388.1 hypothetical protein [Methylobacterium sp. E-045]
MSRTNIALIALGPFASAALVVVAWNVVRWFYEALLAQGFSTTAAEAGVSTAILGSAIAVVVAGLRHAEK